MYFNIKITFCICLCILFGWRITNQIHSTSGVPRIFERGRATRPHPNMLSGKIYSSGSKKKKVFTSNQPRFHDFFPEKKDAVKKKILTLNQSRIS